MGVEGRHVAKHMISAEAYSKLKFHTRAEFGDILRSVFNMYGYRDDISGVVETLLEITEETWDVVRGDLDKQINLEAIRKRRDAKRAGAGGK